MGLPQVLCVDVMGCYLGVLGGTPNSRSLCFFDFYACSWDSFPHIGLPFSPSQEAFVMSPCIFLCHALLLSLGDPALFWGGNGGELGLTEKGGGDGARIIWRKRIVNSCMPRFCSAEWKVSPENYTPLKRGCVLSILCHTHKGTLRLSTMPEFTK